MRIPYCSFMSFSTSWAEGDTILYGVNVNKRLPQHWKCDDKETKIHFEALFYHPSQKGKSILGTHNIISQPLDVVKCIHTCKSPLPNFFALRILLFLTLWYKCSQPWARFCFNMWTIPILSPWCVFLQTCFHFLSLSLSFFDSLFFFPCFRTHPVSHNPSLWKGLWPISECNKLYPFSAIDYRYTIWAHKYACMVSTTCICALVQMHSRKSTCVREKNRDKMHNQIWVFEYSIWMENETFGYLNGKYISHFLCVFVNYFCISWKMWPQWNVSHQQNYTFSFFCNY